MSRLQQASFARRIIQAFAIASLGLSMSWHAWSQQWPAKPVRIVVSNAAGGGTDVVARILAQKLGERLGQPVIVDNKPGAGGIVAADAVAKAAPDGYTFFYTVSGFAAGPVLSANLPYDTRQDFAPVSTTVRGNVLIVVPPTLPVNTIADLVAYSKAHPDALNYASTSNAVTLAVEFFKSITGAKMTNVPYKGSTQAMTDFVGGQIQVLFDPSVSMLPYVNSARAKALAVTGDSRDPAAPTIPTVAESGFPRYSLYSWQGLFAPAKTPHAIVERVQRELAQIVRLPDVKERLGQLGVEPIGSTSAALAATLAHDIDQWTDVAKQIGLKPQ